MLLSSLGSLLKHERLSPKSQRRWTHPQAHYHLGCFFTPYLVQLNQILNVYPFGFGSRQEPRMLQSNQICMKQQLPGQSDTGDFTPLLKWIPQRAILGENPIKKMLSYKTHNKLDLLILSGCCNFPTPVQMPPRPSLSSFKVTVKLKITAKYASLILFIVHLGKKVCF